MNVLKCKNSLASVCYNASLKQAQVLCFNIKKKQTNERVILLEQSGPIDTRVEPHVEWVPGGQKAGGTCRQSILLLCVKLCQICLLETLLTVEVLFTNTLRSHRRFEEVIFICCRRRRIIFYESIKVSTFVLKLQHSSAPIKSRSLIREGSPLELVFQSQCNRNKHFLFNLILHVLVLQWETLLPWKLQH